MDARRDIPPRVEAYEFGPFRLEVGERRLLSASGEVALTPRVFDVLLVLVSRQPHLVTRDSLLREVWPDTVVEEANLSYTISLLRKALGNTADAPRYVQTVAKQGYRFIETVNARDTASDIEAPAGRPSSRRALIATGAALVVVILGLIAALRSNAGWTGDAAPPLRSLAVLPFVNLGPTSEDEWLADGMTHVLIEEFSRVQDLRVISAVSAMRFKGTTQALTEIAEDLDVDGIIVGSVLREDDRMRVGVQVCDKPDVTITCLANMKPAKLRGLEALHLTRGRAVRRCLRSSS